MGGGIGLGGLEGGGSSEWVGVWENPIRKHMNSLPNGPEPHLPDLSNVESTDLLAENNNFVGCKAVVNYRAENNTSLV